MEENQGSKRSIITDKYGQSYPMTIDADEADDGIPFEEKITALTTDLRDQMREAGELDREIKKQLAKIGVEL